MSPVGEDTLLSCGCGEYAANVEKVQTPAHMLQAMTICLSHRLWGFGNQPQAMLHKELLV